LDYLFQALDQEYVLGCLALLGLLIGLQC